MPFLPVPESKKIPKPCRSAEHNPRAMMVLPPGQHIWQCPACGQKTSFHVTAPICREQATSHEPPASGLCQQARAYC